MKGEVAIVTGGASGIGLALGTALARRELHVVLADRDHELAVEASRELVLVVPGAHVETRAVDVRDAEQVARLVSDTVSAHDRLDYMFNNAGVGVLGEMADYRREDWDDVIDVNLRGVAYGVHAAYPVMKAQGFGHIVNTASMAGLVAGGAQGSYIATKHAVVGLSKALRIEAARHGVRVTVLCPGAIQTPILSGGTYGRVLFDTTREQVERAAGRMKPMNVDVFAREALHAIDRNEATVVLPKAWRAMWWLERLSPTLSAKVWRTLYGKLRQELAAPVEPT